MEHLAAQVIPVETMLPAAGQGALGIETRAADKDLLECIAFLDDRETHAAIAAERAFLEAAGGGCSLPIGVYGEVRGDVLHLAGRIIQEESNAAAEGNESGSIEDAAGIGRRLAEKILKR
jgi:hydroxymethylbilane synthase